MFQCVIKENGLPRRFAPRNDRVVLVWCADFSCVAERKNGTARRPSPTGLVGVRGGMFESALNPKFSCRGRSLCRPVYIIFGAFFLFPSARVVTLATPSAPPLRYPKRGSAPRQRFWVCAPIFHALQSTGFSLPQSAYADSSLVRGSQSGTLNFMRCNTKTGTVHAVPVTLFNSRIRRRG